MEKQIKLLRSIERTLDSIQVSGADNLDKMLGCIVTLRSVCGALDVIGEEWEHASIHEAVCEKSNKIADGISGT